MFMNINQIKALIHNLTTTSARLQEPLTDLKFTQTFLIERLTLPFAVSHLQLQFHKQQIENLEALLPRLRSHINQLHSQLEKLVTAGILTNHWWVPRRWRRQFVVAKIQTLENMMQELSCGLEDVKALWKEVVSYYMVDYLKEGTMVDRRRVGEKILDKPEDERRVGDTQRGIALQEKNNEVSYEDWRRTV
ncbi:hypothetical protein BGX38DRAFT_1202485 [Terfezia claveryi]|nr:hypothetical protein BGX38DRAFT_1202485 [Terfezia claveryi]